jgi:hypothetical protein
VWILGTTADDLFPYFDKYGKVVDIFIPRNRRYSCAFSFLIVCLAAGKIGKNNLIHFCWCIFIFKFEGSNFPFASNECL